MGVLEATINRAPLLLTRASGGLFFLNSLNSSRRLPLLSTSTRYRLAPTRPQTVISLVIFSFSNSTNMAEEKEIVITRKTQVKVQEDDIVLDDFKEIKTCILYFFYTTSVIAVLLFFLILDLGMAQLSGAIEQIPGIYPLIAQATYDAVQGASVSNNIGDLCGNCLVSTFCTCLGGFGSPRITPA